MQLGFHICSFLLRERNKRNNYIQLNNAFRLDEQTLCNCGIDLFVNVFRQCEDYENDRYTKKIFKVDQSSMQIGEGDGYKYLQATIYAGGYGVRSSIVNVNNRNVEFDKSRQHADSKKFLFFLAIPDSDDRVYKGMMFFQTIGPHGIKKQTLQKISSIFRENNNNIMLETRSISPESVFNQIHSEGNILKIACIKNNISSDRADNIVESGGKEENVIYKPRLTDSFIDRISSFFNSENNGFIELPDGNDDIKITYKLNDSVKTISIKSLDRISLVVALPQQYVAIDGNAKEQETMDFVKSLVVGYMRSMVFTEC